jgi:hypothetical protein
METKPFLQVYETQTDGFIWGSKELHVERRLGQCEATSVHGIYGMTDKEQQDSRQNALWLACDDLIRR